MSDPLIRRADALIVLSELQRDVFQHAGLPAERMTLAPNFLPDELDPGPVGGPHNDGWLFVGRLSEEKGILELLARWPVSERLSIVGDGPLLQYVQERAGSNIDVLGRRSRLEVLRLLGLARGLVFPSRWFEGAPLTYLESLAAGVPVLAYPPSGVAGDVLRDRSGLVVEWDADLLAALREAEQRFPVLRKFCRAAFERRYSEQGCVTRRINLYNSLTGSL